MPNFSELKKISLREIWKNEASDFTTWLESNIQTLGAALDMDIEITSREASVGDFSLDLLAQDLESSRMVVIENQLTRTDHDHLGKLLTYAAGFNASTVIWIAEEIRNEHRQAMEWLNQRTDSETQFFAVVVEVLKIDDSKPALNFKLVVSPNEWQKSQTQKISGSLSFKQERYRNYFQTLIDELREKHKFTGIRVAHPFNYKSFSSGIQGVRYRATFAQGNRVHALVKIDQKHLENRLDIFDTLKKQEVEIVDSLGSPLEWERRNDKRESFIIVSREGSIDSADSELEEIREWHIETLLKLKEMFIPKIEKILETLE